MRVPLGLILLLSLLFIGAGILSAQAYTAINLQPANSPYGVANIFGLNNQGQVLVDLCTNGSCVGANRTLGIWSNGVITPLTFPGGYSYNANGTWYHMNSSGVVAGTVFSGNNGRATLWNNAGSPQVLPNAPYSAGFGGANGSCASFVNGANAGYGVSAAYGINAAGHILGSTTYQLPGGNPCSAFWIYDGVGNFRVLPFPQPSQCKAATTYEPNPPAFNDADQVVETVQNVSCGASFPELDPAVIQPNGSYSFLPLGTLSAAEASGINDAGEVIGVNEGGAGGLVLWDSNGLQNLGLGGYGYLNQAGEIAYYTTGAVDGGNIAIWYNGVSTPDIPDGLGSAAPVAFNDAGQIAVFTTGGEHYLLSPSGSCAADVTSRVSITRTGFRYNHATGFFELIGSIKNIGDSAIPGPLSIVVDNLPPSATLIEIQGGATLCAPPIGSPYTSVTDLDAGNVLLPGDSISGALYFIDTAQTGFTYSLRVLAGTGVR